MARIESEVMTHDVWLSDVGLDNSWRSFDHSPSRCHRKAFEKVNALCPFPG